jgi:hypothetical protein
MLRRLTAPVAALLVAVGAGALLIQLDNGPREPVQEPPAAQPWDREAVVIVTAAAREDAALWRADLLCRHPDVDAGRAPWSCADAPPEADADYLACCLAERSSFRVGLAAGSAGPATHYGSRARETASTAAALLARLQADTAANSGQPRAWAALVEHPCQAQDAGACDALPVPLVPGLDALASGLGLVLVEEVQ